MDWVFEKREKSLANNAKRIVEDMHKHLDEEKQRNKELENIVLRFQHLCTESLENELRRLDVRKADILSELEIIDRQMLEKRTILDRTREEVRDILANAAKASTASSQHNNESHDFNHDNGKYHGVDRALNGQVLSHHQPTPSNGLPHSSSTTAENTDIMSYLGSFGSSATNKSMSHNEVSDNHDIEQQYLEEEELIEDCRNVIQNFLFLIHQSNIADVIAFALHNNPRRLEFVDVCKVVNFSKQATAVPLLPKDVTCYEGKIIPNHDRDFPDVRDMEVPTYMLPEKMRHKRTAVTFGSLVGAIEVPVVPEVLIDIWRYMPIIDDSNTVVASHGKNTAENIGTEAKIWATTSIDNVNFAVLERIFITIEMTWGAHNIVQIDLFGRHPKTGRLLVESIVPS